MSFGGLDQFAASIQSRYQAFTAIKRAKIVGVCPFSPNKTNLPVNKAAVFSQILTFHTASVNLPGFHLLHTFGQPARQVLHHLRAIMITKF
jgi:hypothetical protein